MLGRQDDFVSATAIELKILHRASC